MKILPLLLFVLLAGLPRLQAGEASLTEAEATAAARNWASLVKSADTAELERLLNENYLHTHGTGKVETKTQFLEALRGGTRKYERCEMSDLRVILLGPGAVVQGNLDVKAVTKDKTLEVINRFMLVMERTAQGLDMVAFQATPTEKK